MKRTRQLLGAVSAIALVAVSSAPAFAADLGTDAGTSIQNTVTVTFNVNNVPQTAVQGTDTLTVDRNINVLVTEVGGTTTVVQGQTSAAVAFQVTNKSNTTADLVLSLNQATTDSFNISNVRYYVESGTTAGFQAGEDILLTGATPYLEDVAEDATRTVYVVGDIPTTGLSAGNTAVVNLVADVHATAAGTGTGPGAKFTNSTGGNTTGIDTVLADGAGTVDAPGAGNFSAANTFVVAGAGVTVSKTSRVISDPVNGTTNPYAIPGAVVEYCIAVVNSGSFTATNISVSDPLPAQVTFAPNSYGATGDIVINGTASAGICSGGTQTDTSYTTSTTTVSSALQNVPAGQTRSLYFRVTIK